MSCRNACLSRKKVRKCSVDGKPVRQRVDRDLEIQVKGQWMPGKMPLPLLEPGKPVKVKVRGTLNHGVMGIGGETTGTTIRFARTTWELDLRTEKAFGAAAERLNGKRVVVTGIINRHETTIITQTTHYNQQTLINKQRTPSNTQHTTNNNQQTIHNEQSNDKPHNDQTTHR